MKKSFVDEKGNESQIIITSDDNSSVNLKANYKLQRPETSNKYMQKGAKAKGILTSDIGIKSQGFAPIFTLALIIALGAIVTALILWRI